jgi:hypothetical protein
MLVSVAIVSLFSLSNILIPDTAPQLVVAEAQQNVNSMEEINFSSPFSNSFSLWTPFLVEYDNTKYCQDILLECWRRPTNVCSILYNGIPSQHRNSPYDGSYYRNCFMYFQSFYL